MEKMDSQFLELEVLVEVLELQALQAQVFLELMERMEKKGLHFQDLED
jgi:hypothetical protein